MAIYRYGESLSETLALVRGGMGREELLTLLKNLYGTGNIRLDATEDEIREEAVRQVRRDFKENS